MSVVTSIILHLREGEDLSILHRINAIITQRGATIMARVDQFMNRQKQSPRMVFGGTYNHTDSDAIVKAFIAHVFEFPDYAMLIVDDERDYSHRIYLAEGADVEQRKQISQLSKWVDDLQAGMTVNCVYCGHRYGPDPGTPVAMADMLKAHIARCDKHPMARLLDAARNAVSEWNHGFDMDRLSYALRRLDAVIASFAKDPS
jgi:hypothetical protein